MKLSIIIRTFDRLEYLVRTIASIDEKSGLNRDEYEIIVVDQNSSDGTLQWLQSVKRNGYYPIEIIHLSENIGDGKGMEKGISMAKGKFIAQHDDDIELVTFLYFKRLICLYKKLEEDGRKVCAVGASHRQGFEYDSAPMRFGKKRYPENVFGITEDGTYSFYLIDHTIYIVSWVTASFIFRKAFASRAFGAGMCNSWCGAWWDEGYDNFLCQDINFWHIDSGETGAHVRKQADKFPSYTYVNRHYQSFL